MRKAIKDYRMIEDGDRVLVGISGGKDSVALFTGLARLRAYMGIDFTLVGVTLDPGFEEICSDYSLIEELAKSLDTQYVVKKTDIGHVVFDIRKEPNPCSLCAKMRRGALHDMANELGCNKVALGHHADDATETFIMNLFNEGRIGNFAPVTYLSRKDVTVIRPMIYAAERDIIRAVKSENLPVVKTRCPADKKTNRKWTKDWLAQLEREHRGINKRIYGAMRRGIWEKDFENKKIENE